MSSIDRKQVIQDLLVAQQQAWRFLLQEHHQQIESYIQQTGDHPITKKPYRASHRTPIPLRENAKSQPDLPSAACLKISDLCMELVYSYCNEKGYLRNKECLQPFLQTVKDKVQSIEDKAQVIFILDASISAWKGSAIPSLKKASEIMKAFESYGGYDDIFEWLALSCSYRDVANSQFTHMILRFLFRHQPHTNPIKKQLHARAQQLSEYMDTNNTALLQKLLTAYCKE